LIDTVVLSELRKRERHTGIAQWLRGIAADMPGRTVGTCGDRILAVDTRDARRWGRLSARIGHGGAAPIS